MINQENLPPALASNSSAHETSAASAKNYCIIMGRDFGHRIIENSLISADSRLPFAQGLWLSPR
jgi:hypothetical protein